MNTNSKVAVSVTIPVYNTSKYLHVCLESLSMQTLQNIEFILIDDGSYDGSEVICEEYAEKDVRFRVIHQNNCGSAVARQTGLDNAKGEYVIVCDSDDWVEPAMYKTLYNEAVRTNADIVVCGYYAEYSDGRSTPKQTWFLEKDGYVDNDDFIRRGAGSSWIKLIRRSLFEKTGASYEPDINMGEDALIIYKLMKGKPKVIQIKANLYHYRRLIGENSYTNNMKMANITQMYYIYDWLRENYDAIIYEDLHYKRALNIAFACLRANDADDLFLKNFCSQELTCKRIMKHTLTLKSLMIAILKVSNIKFSKFLLRKFYPFFYR